MRILRALLPLLLCAGLSSSLPAAAVERDPASRALVDGIVHAYGGAEAIERIAAVHAEGEIRSLMRNEQGSYRRWFKRPRLLRVEIEYPRGKETRLMDGEQAWRGGGGPMKLVSGPSQLAIFYQYKQLDLAHGLLKGSYNLRHAGTETLNGAQTEVLEVWDDEGPPMRLNVDTASHYIVQVSSRIGAGAGAMHLAVEFSDFRVVGGMPMPFHLRNHAGGMRVSETTILRYHVNPPDDPAVFELPLKGHHGKVLASVAATPRPVERRR